MQSYISQLADINKRLQDAVNQLREQQKLVSDIDCPRRHQALLMLLSNAGCKINAANLLRTETERPPCGGLSEIRSGVRFDMKKAAN